MRFFSDPNEPLEGTQLLERFLSYVRINTQSSTKADPFPSSPGQRVLGEKLVGELKELGADEAGVDQNCYVVARFRGNTSAPALGLIAHLDTSSAASGKDVKPLFHENYKGEPIKLPAGPMITIEDTPELKECIGDTIVTSDGSTLLGTDNKAGIAIIMSTIEMLNRHPDVPRPPIAICFTPDEEIGLSPDRFPFEKFGAKAAFTLDGCTLGDINIETFHAESAWVTFTGVATHPGTAKGKLVNALRFMGVFLDRLPKDMAPETTDGRKGFIHPYEISGDASSCKLHMILRDFLESNVKKQAELIRKLAQEVASADSRVKVEVEVKSSYPNMHAILSKKPEILERLVEAVKKAGVEPQLNAVRGGTDGSRLSHMGLPTPNIFVGGSNFHGPTEWLSTRSMALAVCTVLNLLELSSQQI